MRLKNFVFFSILLLLLAGCHSEKNDWVWISGKNLTKSMTKKGVFELSGLHWNPFFNRLYALQDDGDLRILQLDTTSMTFSQLTHIKSLGGPEGVTQVDNTANEFYTIDEKTCEIRRYTHQDDFSSVTLANKWNLKAPPSNMTSTNNEGPEGIEFVPDSYLKTIGFVSSETNEKYSSTKGMGGLLFIAHQKKGLIWVYDVNPNKNEDFAFVGKYKTGKNESCDLSFDRSTGLLYILHNIGNNSLEVTDLSTKSAFGNYKFIKKAEYAVPNPKGNTNIEGFAIAPKFAACIPGNAWLCRDVDVKEEGRDRKDCLRWFKDFKAEGRCVKNWEKL
jgi:hypothetical protein